MKHQPIDLLEVSLNFGTKKIAVGRLLLKERTIYFEYHPHFIKKSLAFSPFQLPLRSGVFRAQENIFQGLFGVFDDSLPDGWGRLLLDRQLKYHHISPEKLSPLDRLALVGTHGMGALCYSPTHSAEKILVKHGELDTLAEESLLILENDGQAFLDELLTLNGSSNGARPKIITSVSQDKTKIYFDASTKNSKNTMWLIKFHEGLDSKDTGAIEFAYSNMARHAGIEVPNTHLFPSEKTAGYFGSQLFDRDSHKRWHMHTLCGLLHANYRIPSLDYETFLKATYVLTKNMHDMEKAFRLAVFNVLAHNQDDHSKNFSYLMDETGTWRLAPAYDLTFSTGPMGEQSMTVLGEGKNITQQHLTQLGQIFSIPNIKTIIHEVQESIHQWPRFAKEAGVLKSSTQKITKVIAKKD